MSKFVVQDCTFKNMKPGQNRDPIDRTCRLIKMLLSGRVTNRDIRDEFGICKTSASKYIDTVSRHFPVGEVGTRAENRTRPESIVYGLVK